MAAPSPDLVVTDPPPLNPAAFPFRVAAFPAQELRDFARAVPKVALAEPPDRAPNPHRYAL